MEKNDIPEIDKLHKMLTDADIQHEYIVHNYSNIPGAVRMIQILYPSIEDWYLVELEKPREGCCSVIFGEGSYGYSQNLLEIMGLVEPNEGDGKVCGWLTAEDVFERIKKAEEARQANFRHVAKDQEE